MKSKKNQGLFPMLPLLLFIVVFLVGPLVYMVALSFFYFF